MQITKARSLKGELLVPGDKSISHRAVMLGSIADGMTEITDFLQGADCLSTINCFRSLGVSIENTSDRFLVHGNGLYGLTPASSILDVGNSGTTARLLTGILAAQHFTTALTGDSSIQKRPMKRIMEPLGLMGADIRSMRQNNCVPFTIYGKQLHGIHYNSPVASAQVKSSVLLAGLYADGITKVTEPFVSRNHSEIMLRTFGAEITSEDTTATLKPCQRLTGQKIKVPGDISAAAYFIAAGLLVPNSELLIQNVGINPTRDGILKTAKAMGADITLLNVNDNGEPTADLLVKSSSLTGTVIGGELIPTLIDELPILAVMAAFAKGTTVIRDAAELKVKESNRIDIMVQNLSAMGADITATDDGMIINGGSPLHGAAISSYGDHRIAMSFAIAALCADGTTEIRDSECVAISYPDFYEDLHRLCI